MNDRATTLVEGRREKMARALGRPLELRGPTESALTEEALEHLLHDGEELYWNELEWEHITAEEEAEDGPLVPLIFPGFLAFVRGPLLSEAMPDALAPAEPRPEVVEHLVLFLAERVLLLEEELADESVEEAERLRGELDVTDGLIDYVFHSLHGLSQEEVALVEAADARR